MKKRMIALLLMTVMVFVYSGCGGPVKGKYAGEKTIGGFDVTSDANSTIDESSGIGFRYTNELKKLIDQQFLMEAMIPPYAINLMTIPQNIQDKEIKKLEDNNLSAAEQEKIYKIIDENTIYFLSVIRIEENDVDSREIFKVFTTSFDHRKDIGKVGESTYYFGYNDNFDRYNLTEEEKAQLTKAVNEIPEFEKNIYISAPK